MHGCEVAISASPTMLHSAHDCWFHCARYKSKRPGLDIVVPINIAAASPRAAAFRHSPLHPLHPDRKGQAPSK